MKEMAADYNVLQSTTGITLPHIVPYMSLFTHINRKPIFKTFYQNQDLVLQSLTKDSDDQISPQYPSTLSYFKEKDLHKFCSNTKKMMSNVAFDDMLLDIFRTEYHIRLHWGSQSRFILHYPENSDEGHEEFEKVITTLFEMCSMSRSARIDV
jgi:hypothetical protein